MNANGSGDASRVPASPLTPTRAAATADFPKISHPKKRAFLAAFSRCGSLSQAAKRAKVDRRTHYNWLREDPAYREAFRQATIEAGDALEDKMAELAHDGNVTAAIFLLKGLRPEKYRERYEHTNLLELDPDKLTAQQLENLLDAWLLQAYRGDKAAVAEAKRALLSDGSEQAPTVIETTAVEIGST